MPRPRSLTDARIAAAALAVVDRGGLAALSMRAVAAELGMATMAVYRYLESRKQLETLLVDLVLDAADTGSAPPGLPWDRRLAVLLGRVRDAVAAHPSAAPLVLARWHASDGARRCAEAVLRILAEGEAVAGTDGRRRGTIHRALIAYLIGAIQLDTTRPDKIPLERFGVLSPDVPAEELFHDGLAALLRGFGPEPASGPPPPGPA